MEAVALLDPSLLTDPNHPARLAAQARKSYTTSRKHHKHQIEAVMRCGCNTLLDRRQSHRTSAKGSRESTSSNSASPPKVIIWYISFSLSEIAAKPAMNSSSRALRSPSYDSRICFPRDSCKSACFSSLMWRKE